MLATVIGSVMPTTARQGALQRLSVSGRRLRAARPHVGKLQRPVRIDPADLDGDGRTDLLVAAFGHLEGELYWLDASGGKHVLRAEPGCLDTFIGDLTGDGLPDVVALFAQGREGLFLYRNLGQGRFEERQLLGFPPVQGSSSFELVDFDQDGHLDVLYTAGDNADHNPMTKKRYHGVYLFMGDGQLGFTQRWFYPVNGAYAARAHDFDGDGDLDIAAIAYFADNAKQPEEAFLYFENGGDLALRPYSMPAARHGRWAVMDTGDLDGDGDVDVVLGNLAPGPTPDVSTDAWERGPLVTILYNTTVP
jgi:hypothetical protein